MGTNFEKAFEDVKALVETFRSKESYYLSNEYQEAEARIDFINKFFIALGWDVNHDTQKDPYRQEVKVEKTQSNQKRPDYTFFLDPNYKDPMFFIEAKKPAKNLKDKNYYFQTIKYGWNAGTPLAILTDFEEFHILDCRYKPNINYVLNGSHQYYHYSQYTDNEIFAKIYYLFSREAVLDNSVERYAKDLKKPSGKAVQRGLFKENIKPIDDDFLEFIDGTRETLARAFKKNDTHLNSEELTEAVQRTIDRLVFIRFLEDKLIEQENYISELGGSGNIWKDFISVCRKLDAKYNGIVFKKHFIDEQDFSGPELKGFSQICDDISHLNSPYDFNVIPIHILGSIYERFLGKVVHATEKRVTVEEKPEVRKAGGVYYTPKYIVDYIVKNTVGELIKGKTPAEISKLRIADIACGSGSFLIGAFDCLLDYHNTYYRDNPDKAVKDGCYEKEGRWVLSIRQKQNILLNNIYGVDIDTQAVEVTQLSLALKMLEDETTATANDMQVLFHEKIIPNLSGNIVCGNSLIGTDILSGSLFSGEEERKLNPMDFETAFPAVFKSGGDSASGFDCVIGNPPYVRNRELDNYIKEYFNKKYQSAMGQYDLYQLFYEKSINLLKNNGLLGYITSNKWTIASYGFKLREFILMKCRVLKIVDVSTIDVFKDASTYPYVLILEKSKNNLSSNIIHFKKISDKNDFNDKYSDLEQKIFENDRNKNFVIKDKPLWLEKIDSISIKLGDICSIKETIHTGNVREKLIVNEEIDSSCKKLLFGKDVHRYGFSWSGKYVRYDKTLIKKEKGEYGNICEPKYFEEPKILLRDISKIPEAVYDEDSYYSVNTLYSIQTFANKYSLKYILGLLHSNILKYYFKVNFEEAHVSGGFLRFKKIYTSQLPIRIIDFNYFSDKQIHDKLVSLVDQMLAAQKELHHAKTDKDKSYYERRCKELDNQIDRLVYELYGLTEEEIKIVEGK